MSLVISFKPGGAKAVMSVDLKRVSTPTTPPQRIIDCSLACVVFKVNVFRFFLRLSYHKMGKNSSLVIQWALNYI